MKAYNPDDFEYSKENTSYIKLAREQAINIAVGCVMVSAMDPMTKIQVIEVLRGIELDANHGSSHSTTASATTSGGQSGSITNCWCHLMGLSPIRLPVPPSSPIISKTSRREFNGSEHRKHW